MKMCEVLKVSKSGYYSWKKRKPDIEDQALMDLIGQIFREHKGRYGYRRVHKEMCRMGITVNRKRIARLMHQMGLKGRARKKYHSLTDSRHNRPVSENLVAQNFKVDQANRVWLSDITYLKTLEGWLYLAVVMDLYSRRILGWELSSTLEKEIVIRALSKALSTYRNDDHLIFHSDRGVQFTSEEFRTVLSVYGVEQSMSGTGNCYDNAPMESFFNTLKTELVRTESITTKYKTRTMIFEYIEIYYNKKRLHSSLHYRTPDEVYFNK